MELDTPVYSRITDRGEKYPKKTIGDLKVGDFIYGDDGKLTEVLHLNSIIFEDVYEVEFEDGEIIKCNKEHLWSVYDKYFNRREVEKKQCLRNTEFLYDNFKLQDKNNIKKVEYRFHVPCCEPIEYPNIQNLTIDPYILGAWLGDGCHSSNIITSGKDDVDEMCQILLNSGAIAIKHKTNRDNVYSITIDRKKDFIEQGFNRNLSTQKSFLSKIKYLDLYKNKHIPERYMYSTVENRLALLQGLMDTDGTIDKDGHCEFTQTRFELIQQVSQLLSSLGIKNNIVYKDIPTYVKEDGTTAYTYRINFRTDKTLPCFRLKRKYEKLPDKLDGVTKTKAIVDVRKTNEKKAMRCITVSNDTGLFLCGENKTITHNSYLSAPYMMARSILIPNHKSYILCPSGNQAQQTFSKIEDLAKGKVASVKGSTGVFLAELMRANAGTDPFVHDKHSHHCELYNGSSIWTVNSVAKNAVGIRSNLNFYDEAGKVEREFFALTEPFCTQDTNFATGADFNIKCYPRQLPNQIIYASSAETIDSQLYDAYKDGAMRMIAGDPEYFVCDITCELSLNPYMDGKPYSPLLSREVIDDAMRKNEYKATREYYNKFDIAGGQDALVKRTTLIANSYAYAPIYQNENDIKQYVIAYDPATKLDNSMIGIGEIFTHPENGLMLKIVDMINLIEKVGNGEKKVIQKPEQVEILKKILLKYNGRVPDYDNLIRILIDAGSGGGGFDIAQYLLRDWIGVDGRKHLGLIDLQDKYLKEEKDKFPGAVDKLTMVSFTKYKTEIYTECQNMINQGLVMFPKSLNLKGEMEFEEEQPDGTIKIITERMNSDEIKSLVEIDLLKEELVAMQKTQNGSTIKFDLLPSKKLENMHKKHCALVV